MATSATSPLTVNQLANIMQAFGDIPGMAEPTENEPFQCTFVKGVGTLPYTPFDPFAGSLFTGPDAIDVDRLHQEAAALGKNPTSNFGISQLRPSIWFTAPKKRDIILIAVPTHSNGVTRQTHLLEVRNQLQLEQSMAPLQVVRQFQLSSDGKIALPAKLELSTQDTRIMDTVLGTLSEIPIADAAARLLTLLDENYALGNNAYRDGSHPLQYELLIGGRVMALGSGGTESVLQLLSYNDSFWKGSFTLVVRSTLDQKEIAMIQMEEFISPAPSYPKCEGRTNRASLTMTLRNFTRPDRGERGSLDPLPRPVGFRGEMVRKLLKEFAP